MQIHALVINNRDTMRQILIRNLELSRLAEFTFSEAKNLSDALARIDPAKTDMIFLEWEASSAIVSDFIRRVRTKQRRHIPIVIITTDSALVKLEQEADDGGVDYYAIRPFTAPTLYQKLAPFFQRLATSPQRKAPTQHWQPV